MSTFEEVKNIDTFTRHTVNGYLRKIQLSLPSENIYYDSIPSIVLYLCLLYFYIPECFDSNNCHQQYALSDDKKIAKRKKDCNWGLIYLTKVVSEGIHRWKFKINIGNTLNTTMTIGVCKIHEPLDTTDLLFASQYYGKAYAWKVESGLLTKGDDDEQRQYTNRKIQDGDIVEMKLDLNKWKLEFNCNSVDYGVAFKDIQQTSYRAALSFYDEDHSIEILEYRNLL